MSVSRRRSASCTCLMKIWSGYGLSDMCTEMKSRNGPFLSKNCDHVSTVTWRVLRKSSIVENLSDRNQYTLAIQE